MLELKRLRNDLEGTIARLNTRGSDFGYLREVILFDERRRSIIQEVEQLKNKRNETSKKIGQYKQEGKDVSEIMGEVSGLGEQIKVLDDELNDIDAKIFEILAGTPNVPRETLPIGSGEEENVEVKVHGELPKFNFEPKPHWDIATDLDIIDFERAAKITGSRFAVYKGLGARLERAVISFYLDLHTTEHGYEEFLPPFLANAQAMFGTGQLPKFGDDMFKIEGTNYYLIPTAEVPLTNLHMNEVLKEEELPLKYTGYTPCFRAEAGSAGRDTRGIIRQHQFNKVELVWFALPEESYDRLEQLKSHAEKGLQKLGLPYRVIELCTGDIGFASANTFDLEVWLPSYNEYKEISSCSNFEDFQARRANIKFKRKDKKELEFIHTLNGSGLAVGRTVAAILENYQNEDGSVTIPEALVPYMNGIKKISKK